MRAAKVRITQSNWQELQDLLFSEYPKREVATFLDCGWKEGHELLVLTIKSIKTPGPGDIESGVDSIQLNEQYSYKQALASERSKFATGLVHSHPLGYAVWPSKVDDKMDSYYAEFFGTFCPDRPFLSMIVSKDRNGKVSFSGRIFWRSAWIQCVDLQVVGESGFKLSSSIVEAEKVPEEVFARLNRLTGAMGRQAAQALWNSKVVIVGAGGTGSALFHSLVRSCIGEIVTIDADEVSISNSERVHGFEASDISETPVYKVDIMKRLGTRINPYAKITPLRMNAISEDAQKHLAEADIIFGCTDSQVGKVLISNAAIKYLLPAIHVNVAMESSTFGLIAEIVQVVRYEPGLPCVFCRDLIDRQLLAQELMSQEERIQRQTNAAIAENEKKQMYWTDEPVLNTVGGTTTIAAECAAKMGVGILTGVFRIKPSFIEFDLLKPENASVVVPLRRKKGCICSHTIDGGCDQVEGWI